MNEQKLKNDFACMKDDAFKEINDILKRHDYDWFISISYFISSLFSVDGADLLSKDKSSPVVYARWMFWYALYNFCGKNYKSIADFCTVDGVSFKVPTIMEGIQKIKTMIDTEPFFHEKWYIIKSIIASKRMNIKKELD